MWSDVVTQALLFFGVFCAVLVYHEIGRRTGRVKRNKKDDSDDGVGETGNYAQIRRKEGPDAWDHAPSVDGGGDFGGGGD